MWVLLGLVRRTVTIKWLSIEFHHGTMAWSVAVDVVTDIIDGWG